MKLIKPSIRNTDPLTPKSFTNPFFITMKKSFFIFFYLLSIATSTMAQPAPTLSNAQKQRQQQVRNIYAEAQQNAELQKNSDNEAAQYVTVTWPRMEAAVGKVVETIEYFSVPMTDEKTEMRYYSLQLVRRNYKRLEASIGDNYSEYLFDTKSGILLFYYEVHNNWWCDEQVKVETRCYFNADGSYSSGNVKLTALQGDKTPYYPAELQEINALDIQRESSRYSISFNTITNFTME